MKWCLGTLLYIAMISPGAGVAATPSGLNGTVSCLNDSRAAFEQTSSDPDKKSILTKYLGCFPSAFSDFEKLFGYNRKTKVEGPLYADYSGHFDFIARNYDSFDKKDFSEKFISLASGASGRHYVDAEEMLQQTALAPLIRDPSIGLVVLSRHSDSEIERYWYFVLDTVEQGVDRNQYSCPDDLRNVKACKMLSDIKSHQKLKR